MPRWTKTPKERLLSRIEKQDSGCWKWIGTKNKKGYGMMVYKGRIHASHRVSWQEFYGEIPEGMLICHKCDNPSCVNPDHLFVGSNQDNMDDMKQKGRASKSKDKQKSRRKISREKELEIIERYKTSNVTQKSLANEFGIALNHVRRLTRYGY